MVPQQTTHTPPPLKGVATGYQSSVDYNACRMKGVYVPNSSPYDISTSGPSQTSTMVGDRVEQSDSQHFVGGSIDAIDDKQVFKLIAILF